MGEKKPPQRDGAKILVKEGYYGKPNPQVVEVSFCLSSHGWNVLQQSDSWHRLLEDLEVLQKE